MELSDNGVKFTLKEVLIVDGLVLVPTDEVYIMAQTFQSFLVWPRDLVDSIFDPLVRTLKPTVHYYTFKFTCYFVETYLNCFSCNNSRIERKILNLKDFSICGRFS